jgi:branched-chain amino acid transport system permease protein
MPARSRIAAGLILLALALVPPVAALAEAPFYVDLFTRVMIFAIAAISLDFVLGYGGMGGFHQAGYLAVGAYAVGILGFYGLDDGLLQFGTAIAAAALVALVIGAVSLRTSGVHFLMITLAFGQMLYFLGISLTAYGGDDGLTIASSSDFGRLIDLGDGLTLYYVIFAVLALSVWLCARIVESRFGMVMKGIMINERRMRALGFPTFRYKLAAFVISGAICGVAGALLANQAHFVSPAIAHWSRSGEILMMVIIGGMGTLFGPLLGAVVLLVLEDLLSGWTEHWQLFLGPILVVIVMATRRGVFGVLVGRSAGNG